MKKLLSVIMIMSISMMFVVTASAWTGGYLDGQTSDSGITELTDSDTETEITFNSEGTTVVSYTLDSDVTATEIMLSNSNWNVFDLVFYDSTDTLIDGVSYDDLQTESASGDTSYYELPLPIENVARVEVALNAKVSTGSDYTASEFDIKTDAIGDTEAPAAPTGLDAAADDGEASLTWDANSESDLDGYHVYEDGVQITGSPITGESYTATGLTNGTEYSYTVTAVDTSGNESTESAAATVTPTAPDTTPPEAPTGLDATGGDGEADLTWDANSESDLDGYHVYEDGVQITGSPITGESYTATGLTNDTEYSYTVTAVDTSGNESTESAAATVTPVEPDTTAPAAPTGLESIAGADAVSLKWDANSESDLDGYNIYVNGQQDNGETVKDTQYTVTDLVYGETYDFHITGIDTAGNESDPSATVTDTPAEEDNSLAFGNIGLVSAMDVVGTGVSFITHVVPDFVLLGLGIIMSIVVVMFLFWIVDKIRMSTDKSYRLEAQKTGTSQLDRMKSGLPFSRQEGLLKYERKTRERNTRESREMRSSGRDTRSGRSGRMGRQT